MENKAKKILAGVGLGLVGMSCLTGCSLTDSQQKALDLLTEKSDEIISLLEENLELTNSQLSKADAIELLGLARTKLSLGKYNELLMKTTSAAYEGFFEKKIGYAQSNAPYVYYKKTNDMIYTALCDFDSSLSILQTANFVNNEAYTYNAKSDEKQENTYTSGMFDMGILLDSFDIIGLKSITADDIANIEYTEDGYKFNVLATTYNVSSDEKHIVSTYLATFEISKNADLKLGTFDIIEKTYLESELQKDENENIILDESGLPISLTYKCNDISSYTYCVEYQYENIDFSQFDDLIAQLEA